MTTGFANPARLFTIGHSNRSFEEFLFLLNEYKIQAIADIRRYPSSRKFPHFNQKLMRELLAAEKIRYVWFETLGGYRQAKNNTASLNTGLKSQGFRNYADHMLTAEFQAAVAQLLGLSIRSPTAVMCAEKFFWKCHRRLLCDFLTAQGVAVEHIFDQRNLQPHKLMPGTVITKENSVIYPKISNAES